MSPLISNGDLSMISQDESVAKVFHPLTPGSEQLMDAQRIIRTLAEEGDGLKENVTEEKENLMGAAEAQDLDNVTDMAPSAKFDLQASRARLGELRERNEKLKAYIFETQVFCAQAAWRAEEVRLQVMDPELRKTCERVAEVRQRAAQLEVDAAVRRGDELQVELDEAKKQLSSFAATEQQLKLQLADSTSQLEGVREQLQQLQAKKDEEIAAARREAAVSRAEVEALREQLRLAQQQVVQQEHHATATAAAAAAAIAVTTTAAIADTTATPSAGDLDLLVHASIPFATCAAAAAAAAVDWEVMASSAVEDALWKEVNDLRAQLVEVKADGRDTAERLRAVEGKCDAVLSGLDAIKSAHSTPANRCEWRAPATAATTPSRSPCLPASVGVMTRSQTRAARKGLFSPLCSHPSSGKRAQRDDGSDGNDDDVAVKRPRAN
ncbi:hypothetical protein Vretimale_2644 [Volvox reticuliferus]|uniref:Uncharacterized protein n=1 Tax=Volvox reticuliferus TaxID=1737510 RepID=A0A8J4C4P5_9CHLO|nr:hypothetical protein Vretifemale_2030 [Volvox reticuliferus]GIL96932.1 hypothetical protein Vretimale_2644 [Volvox reticuliferus]